MTFLYLTFPPGLSVPPTLVLHRSPGPILTSHVHYIRCNRRGSLRTFTWICDPPMATPFWPLPVDHSYVLVLAVANLFSYCPLTD